MADSPWKTIKSQVIHRSPWLTLYEDDVITPNGKPGKYTYVESPPFVIILAYDGKQFIMIRQYRYPIRRMVWEFPGGSINEDEDAEDAARRELTEETGFTAAKWTRLGTIDAPNPATVFLAEELGETTGNKMAEEGISEMKRYEYPEIDEMIATSEITDAKTLASLMLFVRYRTMH